MKLCKIYTERKNTEYIHKLLNICFDSFTVYYAEGFWLNQKENSIVFEVLTDNEVLVRAIAENIKKKNNQQAVLVTCQKINAELV